MNAPYVKSNKWSEAMAILASPTVSTDDIRSSLFLRYTSSTPGVFSTILAHSISIHL
jgi:hypothetical protein